MFTLLVLLFFLAILKKKKAGKKKLFFFRPLDPKSEKKKNPVNQLIKIFWPRLHDHVIADHSLVCSKTSHYMALNFMIMTSV